MSGTRRQARKQVSNQHVKSILTELSRVKNIVYYAVCLPEQFAEWLDEGHVSAEDKLILHDVSSRISQSLFSTGTSAEFEIVSEDEVIALNTSLFVLSGTIKLELKAWRNDLQKWQPAGESLVIVKNALMNGVDEFDVLLDKRTSILNAHCNWRSLPQDEITQLEEIRKKLEYLKKGQQFAIDMLLSLMKVDTSISMPLHQHVTLMQHIEDLIVKQLELERQICNRTMLERFQHAMISLVSLQKEKSDTWLFDTLTNNSKFRHAISECTPKLVPLQKKFNSYLSQRTIANRDVRNAIVFGLASLTMNSIKVTASEAYQKRVKQEQALNQAAFFNDKNEVGRQYQKALGHRKKGNYQAALKGFLQGTLKMHVQSFYEAGDMILQGQGCSADAATACDFMLIACGLEEFRQNRISMLVSLQEADALSIATQGERSNNNASPDVGAYRMADADIMKKIYFMKVSVMERLFRLGEALILMIIMRDTVCDKNTVSFKRACFFFEYAYKYIKGAYDRKAILRNTKPGQRAVLDRECTDLDKKMKQCQKDIKEQFSYLEEDMYCRSAPAIIADFYKRFEFDAETSPRLAAGVKR